MSCDVVIQQRTWLKTSRGVRQPASFSIDVTTCAGDEGAAFYAIFFCVILVLICCWVSICCWSLFEDAPLLNSLPDKKWPATIVVFIITFVVWCGLFFGYNLDEINRSLDYYPAAPDGTCLVLNQTLTSSVCCKTSNDKCTPNAQCRSALFKDCSTLQTLYTQDSGQLYLPQQLNSTLVVESKCCAYKNGDDTSTKNTGYTPECYTGIGGCKSMNVPKPCNKAGIDRKDFSCDTCSVGKLELLYYTSDEASDKNSPSTTCNNVSGCYIKSYPKNSMSAADTSSWSSEHAIGDQPYRTVLPFSYSISLIAS